jgi:Glutamate-1-semialdehyde aminotransferase
MRTTEITERLHRRAERVIAAGVSSDVRRARAGRSPLYVAKASGSRLTDVDGNEYVDFVLGQGPMLLGHSHPDVVAAVTEQVALGQAYAAQHPLEAEVAELVTELVPNVEQVRFNTVGSEATHGAWRIARGYTGRPKILKFEGHYHGWLDQELVSLHPDPAVAGSPTDPIAVLGTGGQPSSILADLVIAPWNDAASFERIYRAHAHEVAAVVMEPVLCNTGCIAPDPAFLKLVRDLTSELGSLLIFDEVITGFRLAAGGAQEYLKTKADMAVFGKAIAGGLPVACIASRAEIMQTIVDGRVGHSGTFNSNPIGMAAARASLMAIRSGGTALYDGIRAVSRRLTDGIEEIARAEGLPLVIETHGTVFQTYFAQGPVRNYRDFAASDRASAAVLAEELLDRGVNIVGRGLWFLSAAHDQRDIDVALEAFQSAARSDRLRASLDARESSA